MKQSSYHISVLTREVITFLNIKPHGVYVDATFGGGGHTRALLESNPHCTVIAFDWDMAAIERNGYPLQELFPDRLMLVWSNFAHIEQKLKKMGVKTVDGIFADFGTSQHQITSKEGFSLYSDTPLDMRMSSAHYKITAASILAHASEAELVTIFKEYGQEINARSIARAIVAQRKISPLATTAQLARLIERVVGVRAYKKIHPATRVFQALRIVVNHELENIHAFLSGAVRMVHEGGRIACISFHSLEDRLVKQFFKDYSKQHPESTIITRQPVVASDQEVALNRSSRSAKLRVLEI